MRSNLLSLDLPEGSGQAGFSISGKLPKCHNANDRLSRPIVINQTNNPVPS